MKSHLLTAVLVIFISAKSFGFAVNDSCQGAILLTVENSGSLFTPLRENLNLSSSTEEVICGSTNYMDLWYYFVATNDTQVVLLKSLTFGLLPSTELLTGNCGALTSVNCYNGGVLYLYNLTVGQTYYLRTYYFSSGMEYEISLLNVPSNDVCNTAYNLTVYRSDQPYIAGLYFWTAASNAGSNLCNPFNDYDVWFKFTAADTAQVLYIDGIAPYFEYEIFSGNCGSLVQKQCGGFNNTDHVKFQNLVVGQQYYFRMLSAVNNQAPLFKVALLNPVGNDHCQGAITIPMSASFSDDTEVSGDLWFGFPSIGTCTGENDLWYTFTANANSAFIKVQNFSAMSFSVYSGNCTSLTNVQCSIPVNGKVTGLSSGTTYYIQLHTTNTKQNHFSIAVTPVLGNDDCDGAITVTPGDKLYPESVVEATTFSATESLPGCAGNADDDVWFKFTANRTNYVLDVTPEDINLYNVGFVYELFSGNCGSLTSIKCDTVKTDILDPIKNLTIGQTYYLRIYTASATQFSHFKLAIYKSNDECIDAENLILTNNPSDVNERIYNSRYATQSLPGCQQNADDDIWFSFTASQTSHSYVISDYHSSFNPVVELFSGTCGSLTSLACISGTQGNFPDLTPGQQYYFRAYYSLAGGLSHFRIRVFTSPTNDEITGARQLTVTNDEVLALTNQFTAGALPSFPNYCDSTVTVIEDVWYYFVAPQTAQYLINTSSINQSEFNLEAYSAPNNLQSNLISCGGIAQIVPEAGTLTAGDTVWFRVYPNSSGGSYKGDFDLMVSVYPSAIINDEPADALNLNFTNSYQYTYNSNNFSLSSVTNSCLATNGSNKDAWFKFNAPSLKTSIVVDDPTDVYSFIEIFSGSPGNLTSIECSDNILNLPASLIPGQQYYARILNSGGAYDIRIGIFYNDTLEKNNLVGVKCLGPNLVPNPSAECYTCNDVCKAQLVPTGSEFAGYYNTDNWFMATDGSADYFNSCAGGGGQTANAPTSYIGFGNYYVWSAIVPRNGKGYLGVFTYTPGNYREYIETELTQELIPGNSYLVSFYVNKNYNNPVLSNKAGALFTTDRILVTNNNSFNLITNSLPFEPQVAWNDSFYIQGDKWYNVSGIFVADKPYKYLTIGNFETNSGTSIQNTGNFALGQLSPQSTSYINIDDVVVAEVPSVIDDSCKATVTAIHPVKPPAKSSFIIYPNPAHSTINWDDSQFENAEVNVEVYSITGQIIYKAKTISTSLSIENYLPGLYFIRINDGGHFYSAKFVKE